MQWKDRFEDNSRFRSCILILCIFLHHQVSAQASSIASHYQLVLGHALLLNEVTGFPLGTNFCPWKFFDGYKWHFLFKKFHKGKGQPPDSVALKLLHGYPSEEQVKLGELVKEMYNTITEGLAMKHIEVSEHAIKIKPGATINVNASNQFDLLDAVMEED